MDKLQPLELLQQGVKEWNTWRKAHEDIQLDLSNTNLRNYNLRGANLSRTSFSGVNLSASRLSDANLSYANLNDANLSYANLNDADLSSADLSGAYLNYTKLRNTNLSNAIIGWTAFGNVDLRLTKGLEKIIHRGPSEIGINTLKKLQRDIPEAFLRGTGLDDSFIAYIRDLIAHPIEYHTCFISYSSKDDDFTRRLYTDLQNNGVRCWFAPEDMKAGDKIRTRIDTSIKLYNKLLLVLSRYSVLSQLVEQEVETALERERRENCAVLFPIRLDKVAMEIKEGWPALVRHQRHIGDFTNWTNPQAYQIAFNRLLTDLKKTDELVS